MSGATRPARNVRMRLLGALLGGGLALAVVLAIAAGGSSPAPARGGPRPLPAAVGAAELARRSGVRVVRVAATGGGGLLDLRYQVVEPDAAVAVHDADTPPALVDERSGQVLSGLLMGHMHHGRLKAGLSYYLIFTNPGDVVRPGDRVSVVLGDARLAHVRVR
jgi:hypothetical protein